MKSSRSDKTELKPFELKLPTELQIEPKWTIDLPAKHKAQIYDYEVRDPHRVHFVDDEGLPLTKGFKLVIVNSKGKASGHHYNQGQTFANLLDLKLTLDQWAIQLTPKKRTIREEIDLED